MKYIRFFVLLFIALVCIEGFYYALSHSEKKEPVQSPIKMIAQTGPIKEGLKTDHLAEILGLSADHPQCLSTAQAAAILKKSPFIKEVSTAYWNAETLYIDYTLRHPTFALIDFEDTAVDLEGHLFPLEPYFTPKNLPELYLGFKKPRSFEKPLGKREMDLAIHLYYLLKGEVGRIDLSHIDESSLGRREIIVMLVLPSREKHILRLSTHKYQKEISDYQSLRKVIQRGDYVIDLRIPKLGFITSFQNEEQ